MHVKTSCKHFTWRNIEFISMNKIDQNMLKEPYCDLNKLDMFFSCPKDCKWFEKTR